MTLGRLRLARDLVNAYVAHGRLALLFDYDGTLTPIVAHPNLARLDRAMRSVLRWLAARPHIVVGIISGRSLEDLKRMARIPGAILAGVCGLEIEFPGAAFRSVARGPTRKIIRRILSELQSVLLPYPDAWIEDKQIALTVHYRAVAARLRPKLRRDVRHVLDQYGGSVRRTEGPRAVEILPEVGADKGTAVRTIVGHLGLSGPEVFYAGDSANDVQAFRCVRELGGLAAKIGGRPTRQAKHWLAAPAALCAVLTRLKKELTREDARREAAPRRTNGRGRKVLERRSSKW